MNVVIADDQRVVREGLATIVGSLPDVDVVGLAADGNEAVDLVAAHLPEVVLMDLRMPGLDGVGATSAIKARYPDTRVVVLTTYADDQSIIAALSAGATGYLTKDATRDDIRRALEGAAAGQGVLDPAVQAALLQAASVRPTPASSGAGEAGGDGIGGAAGSRKRAAPPDGLTDREAEVLALIGQGLSNQEIASRLYVSEATVKTHVNRIFAKTASRDRAQAAAYAHRHGITPA